MPVKVLHNMSSPVLWSTLVVSLKKGMVINLIVGVYIPYSHYTDSLVKVGCLSPIKGVFYPGTPDNDIQSKKKKMQLRSHYSIMCSR